MLKAVQQAGGTVLEDRPVTAIDAALNITLANRPALQLSTLQASRIILAHRRLEQKSHCLVILYYRPSPLGYGPSKGKC